ncbi:MAG: rhodanese-like domain-containing protein [Desulfurococcaceae archaeon TW002]
MKAYSVLEMRGQRLIAVGLVAVLLLAFVAVPEAFAEASWAGAYEDVSVDAAYKMIKKGTVSLVLDVRNQSEYNLGHLYDAVLVPVYELEDRISELQEHINDPIIVYCKAGSRSQIACQILASNGFTKVYNMLGGITAWIKAGYPIYTTYHYVTVNVVGKHISANIEPILLYQTSGSSCVCQSCSQDQELPSTNTPLNIAVTTLEQDEVRTVTLVTYEANDTTYEVLVTQTLLWNYNEASTKTNRTAKFISTEIAAEDISLQFYSLSYIVHHEEYNLTIHTTLTQLNSITFNSSFTIIDYVPAHKSELISLEFAEFNSSVTLSQLYFALGKVAKELGKAYGKSEDKTLRQFAQNYYIIGDETKHLSKIVKEKLEVYDKKIIQCSVLLADGGNIWDCFFCVGLILTTYLSVPLCATCAACAVACATIFTIWWCIGCITIPCSACIISLASHVYACCMCAEFMGWIDCPMG